MITKPFHAVGAQRGAISALQAGLIVVSLLVIAGGTVFLTGQKNRAASDDQQGNHDKPRL